MKNALFAMALYAKKVFRLVALKAKMEPINMDKKSTR